MIYQSLKHTTIIGLLFAILLFLPACGRKQKNIFSFSDQDIPPINKLSLPVVRGVKVTKITQINTITWLTPDLTKPFVQLPMPYKKFSDFFVGYNIYRLVRNNIIPKNSLNKKPLTTTTYVDKKIKHNKRSFYLIKAVFVINKQTIEGPASAIAGTPS